MTLFKNIYIVVSNNDSKTYEHKNSTNIIYTTDHFIPIMILSEIFERILYNMHFLIYTQNRHSMLQKYIIFLSDFMYIVHILN